MEKYSIKKRIADQTYTDKSSDFNVFVNLGFVCMTVQNAFNLNYSVLYFDYSHALMPSLIHLADGMIDV